VPRWREQPMGSHSVEPAQGQPRAIAIQVTGVDEVAGVELVQVVEDNGLTAGEVFGSGELQAVDAGSAPVSDQLKAAARLPKSARYPVGETDHIGGVGIHQVQCGGHEPTCRRGSWARAHSFTRWYRSGTSSLRAGSGHS
jgi:hypothetical protein